MPNYSFYETARFFAERLQAKLPEEMDSKGVELFLDKLLINISPTSIPGSIQLSIALGLLLHPAPEVRLRDLLTNQFLGVNTGGCTLCLDEAGVTIHLKVVTSPYTPPQENWEWLHRIVSVAYEWNNILALWDEFVPLLPSFPSQEYLKGGKV